MQSFDLGTTWRVCDELGERTRRAFVMAVALLRMHWGRRKDVRVSRLSDDWLQKHEIESSKHDAAL